MPELNPLQPERQAFEEIKANMLQRLPDEDRQRLRLVLKDADDSIWQICIAMIASSTRPDYEQTAIALREHISVLENTEKRSHALQAKIVRHYKEQFADSVAERVKQDIEGQMTSTAISVLQRNALLVGLVVVFGALLSGVVGYMIGKGGLL